MRALLPGAGALAVAWPEELDEAPTSMFETIRGEEAENKW